MLNMYNYYVICLYNYVLYKINLSGWCEHVIKTVMQFYNIEQIAKLTLKFVEMLVNAVPAQNT